MEREKILKIMTEAKREIARRCSESSPMFYDDIRNEELDWICFAHPEINELKAEELQALWKEA